MKTMKIFYLLIIVLITSFGYSQNIEKLKENNGFRKIKLNSNINDYVDKDNYYDFVKRDSTNLEFFGSFDYDYIYASSDYDRIGNTKIHRIFVNTLNDIIYEIYIVLEKNWEIAEMTELAYGQPTYRTSDFKGFDLTWITDGKKIICNVIGYDSHNYFQLRYTDVELRNKAWKQEEMNKKNKALKEF